MAASAKTRDRIRKLLALTASPNECEAARAREQADRLMAKHGLSPSDFEEDVMEVVDDARDALRQRLAIAVSVSRRVDVLCNKNQIAFRGRRSLVDAGRSLYQLLVRDVSSHCEINAGDPGRHVWRTCFWSGFVDSVVERLIDDEVVQEASKPAPKKRAEIVAVKKVVADEVVPVAVQVQRASQDFAQYFAPEHVAYAVSTVQQDAYRGGRQLGNRTAIPPREAAVGSERMLGAAEEDEEDA